VTKPPRLLDSLATIIALGIAGAVALPVPTAQASLISFSACDISTLSEPFGQWGDWASYELSPGGDFESSTWMLEGGAQVVDGSEPYAATGTLGRSSLSLPAGASAQSPLTCVDAAYPTIRFFIHGTGLVAVGVVDGDLYIPAGIAVAGGAWQPTLPMLTLSAVVAAASDGSAQVSIRLTALAGHPHVDDVFIDPWNRG
jgi:hypothetical protein